MLKGSKIKYLSILLISLIVVAGLIFPQIFNKSGKVNLLTLNINEFSDCVSKLAYDYANISENAEIIFKKDETFEFENEIFISSQTFTEQTGLNAELLESKIIHIFDAENTENKKSELLSLSKAKTNNNRDYHIDLSQNQAFKNLYSKNENELLLSSSQSEFALPLKVIAEELNLTFVQGQNKVILSHPFATARLIALSQEKSFETFGATEVISGFKNYHILQYPDIQSAENAFNELSKNEKIDSVEVDTKTYVQATAEPEVVAQNEFSTEATDYYSWGVEAIGADTYSDYLASEIGEKNLTKLIVAVLDTGIDANHFMIKGKVASGGKSFVSTEPTINDFNGHGTHVSSTISETTLSNVQILPLKVLGANGEGYTTGIISAIEYCIDQKSKGKNIEVMNMSLGAYSTSTSVKNAMNKAITDAHNAGIVSIAAAGNENSLTTNNYPASIDKAVTISAVGKSSGYYFKASYSNYGSHIDFCAPGDRIIGAYSVTGGLCYMSGTSMAAPHVAGVFALLLSDSKNNYTISQIEELLKENCLDLGSTGKDTYFGYGLVQIQSINVSECASVELSHQSGEYSSSFSLTLSCSESNSVIYYTLNGSTPTLTNGIKYFSPITINSTCTIKAVAFVFSSSGEILKQSEMVSATYHFEEEDTASKYVVSSAGVLTAYEGTLTKLIVPEKVKGVTVKSIGSNAFSSNNKLESISLPSSVENIRASAFEDCINLKSVNAPGVTVVENNAFEYSKLTQLTDANFPNLVKAYDFAFNNIKTLTEIKLTKLQEAGVCCFAVAQDEENLKEVELPNLVIVSNNLFSGRAGLTSVKIPHAVSIEQEAFYHCGITEIDLPLVKTIRYSAFDNCKKLTTINAPILTSISEKGFYQCSALKEFTAPKLKQVGASAFYACGKLETLDAERLEYISYMSFMYCHTLTKVNLPNVKYFEQNAFFNCTSLTSISLPNVISIEEKCFASCQQLKSVTLSRSIQVLKPNAFSGASANLTIMADITNPAIKEFRESNPNIFFGDFAHKISKGFSYEINFENTGAIITGVNEYALKDSEIIVPAFIEGLPVVEIANNAFKNVAQIKTLNLPNALEIGESAFEGCKNLIDAYLPNVEILGKYSFKDCVKLDNLNIPKIKTISDYAIFNCEKLAEIELNSYVKSLGNFSLGYSGKVGDERVKNFLIISDNNIALNYGINNGLTCQSVYSASTTNYYYQTFDDNGVTKVRIYSIIETAFGQSLEIPSQIQIGTKLYDVVEIGKDSFYNASVKRIKLPNTVTTIGKGAFYGCEELVEIEMPNVTLIDEYAFYDCHKLQTINAPNLTVANYQSFVNCHDLKLFNAPKLEFISDSFYGCFELRTLYLPNIKYLDGQIFSSDLKIDIYLGNNFTNWYNYVSIDGITIHAYKNSTAESFAKSNNINFEEITEFKINSEPTIPEKLIKGVIYDFTVDVGGVPVKTMVYVGASQDKSSHNLVAQNSGNLANYAFENVGNAYVYLKVVDWLGNEVETNVFSVNVLKETTIVVEKGGNGLGNISFVGFKELNQGDDFTLTMSEIKGYKLSSISVNWKKISESALIDALENGLTISNVASPKHILATFDYVPFEISVTKIGKGVISGGSTIYVEHNQSHTVTVTPNVGYFIKSIKVNGTEISAQELENVRQTNSYVFNNVTDNHTFEVEFEPKKYHNTITCGENGTTSINGDFTSYYGDRIKIEITPNLGYHIKNILVNGQNKASSVSESGGDFYLTQEDEDFEIVVEFEEIIYLLDVKVFGSGKFELSSYEPIKYGQSRYIIVAPDAGLQAYLIKINGKTIELNEHSRIVFNNITENQYVEIIFKSDFEVALLNFITNPINLLIVGGVLLVIVVVIILLIKRARKNKMLQ